MVYLNLKSSRLISELITSSKRFFFSINNKRKNITGPRTPKTKIIEVMETDLSKARYRRTIVLARLAIFKYRLALINFLAAHIMFQIKFCHINSKTDIEVRYISESWASVWKKILSKVGNPIESRTITIMENSD